MTARARARYELTAEDKSGKAFRSFRRNVTESTRELAGFAKGAAALGGTAVLGGLAALTRRAFQTGDQIGKLSTRLGVSTEFLSEMGHAAQQTGVSFQQFGTGIQRMTRRIAEGSKGTTAAIEALGLSLEDLQKLDAEQQFLAIAGAMQRVENQGERVRLAFKLFDTEGVGLLQTMKGGTAAIEALRAEARDLGTSLSTEQVKAMEAYNDAVGRLNTSMQGLGYTIASELAPALAELLDDARNLPGAAKALAIGDTSAAIDALGGTVRPGIAMRERTGVRGLGSGFDTGAVDALLASGPQPGDKRPQEVTDKGVERTNELLDTLIEETRELRGAFTLG